MKKYAVLLLLSGIWLASGQSQLPVSHIYALQVEEQDNNVKLQYIGFLSSDNPEGYNNQPAWMPDGSIYYSTRRPEDDQNEIYGMDIQKASMRVKTRITQSLEDEYSPTLHPDGTSFCCVRVEQDGETQHLWKFPLDRSGGGEIILPHVINVGYFTWLDDQTVALFEVGDPHELLIRSIDGSSSSSVARNIGRTLALNEDGMLVYIDIVNEEYRYIKKYDPEVGSSVIIKRIHNKCGDFGMSGTNTFYIGEGSDILRFRPGIDYEWKKILDLSTYGIQNITRIVSHDDEEFLIVDQN